MAARRIDVRLKLPEEFGGRWRKAGERLKAMSLLMESGALDTAVMVGIQSAIAAADAFTIRHLGKYCVSERHEDVVALVESVPRVAGVAEASHHLKRLIVHKSVIEYSERYPLPVEAENLCRHARRFVEFVGRNLKPGV